MINMSFTKYTKTIKIFQICITAKQFLHSDELNEWDTVFDPGGKQEYTEEQLIRFAEMWATISVQNYIEKLLKLKQE